MNIAVVASDDLKAELLQQGIREPVTIEWFTDIGKATASTADACIDLLFSAGRDGRILMLEQMEAPLIIVNDVTGTNTRLPDKFVRINGWPGFLRRPVVEASGYSETIKKNAVEVFNCFNKKTEWEADAPGFITARIISMIINEAYFALQEQVSSKDEIDIAMRSGTNYPHGPFEWSKIIGLKNIYTLLLELSRLDKRYQPCDLLKQESV